MSQNVIIEMGGNVVLTGLEIEQSKEILVLSGDKNYLYIIRDHIRGLTYDKEAQETALPQVSQVVEGELNIDQLLQNARNFSLELVLIPGKELHGRIGAILDDYFEFHTPLYKTLYIAKKHVKWLIPHAKQDALIVRYQQRPEPSLVQQLKQLKGTYVQLNQRKEGYIVDVNNDMLELEHIRGERSFVNIQHVHVVWVDVKH